jgi:zinc protease
MLMRGTTSMTRQELQDALDQYRAELSVSGTPGEISVNLKTLRGNLRPVLDIVRDVLRNPSFPEEELKLLQESRQASAEQRLTNPTSIASTTVQKQVSQYEKDDPRYIPSLEEEVERIQDVSLDQIRNVYEELVAAQQGELTIVGDFDPQDVVPVVQDFTADWSSEAQYERIAKVPVNNEKGELQKINTPDKAQATYFAAMTLPMKNDHPDYPALVLGNYILGGGALSSRLGNRVRQDEGLSYGVSSAFQSSAVDERSIFYIYAIVNPDNADKLHEVIQEELKKLLEEGVTEQEVASMKEGFLQNQDRQRSDDGTLTRLLGTHLLTGRTMQFTADFEQRLESLTVEDVNAALRKHIDPQRLYIVIAGDFERDSQSAE